MCCRCALVRVCFHRIHSTKCATSRTNCAHYAPRLMCVYTQFNCRYSIDKFRCIKKFTSEIYSLENQIWPITISFCQSILLAAIGTYSRNVCAAVFINWRQCAECSIEWVVHTHTHTHRTEACSSSSSSSSIENENHFSFICIIQIFLIDKLGRRAEEQHHHFILCCMAGTTNIVWWWWRWRRHTQDSQWNTANIFTHFTTSNTGWPYSVRSPCPVCPTKPFS